MVKISIVIPIYNVEFYIEDCITSIGLQDYRDFEVVLVDDGSPDNSCAIAEKIASKFQLQYKVIHQSNQGVSAARNKGIKEANGEYILMVDADDILNPSFLSHYVHEFSRLNRKDVIFSNFKIVDKDKKFESITKYGSVQDFTSRQAQHKFLYHEIKFLLPTLMVRKDFLVGNNIWFDNLVRYSEDVQFIWKVLACADNVKFINLDLYNYCLHSNSTMTSSNSAKIKTGFEGIDRLYDEFIANNQNVSSLVKNELIFSWKLAALHGAAKMLTYDTFKSLMFETMTKETIIGIKHSSNPKVRILGYIMGGSSFLTYQIMKRF